MATQTFNLTIDSSTDALFRAWGSTLSAALGSLLTPVTQSGQINWLTVTKATGADTAMGFEVFRFNDPLQATYPLYLKVEYGSGGNGSVAALWLTIGKSVDGAGGIGGVLFSRTQVIRNGSAVSAQTCYASSGDGALLTLAFSPASGSTNTNGYLCIERARDNSGGALGEGLLVMYGVTTATATVAKVISYTLGSAITPPFGLYFAPITLSTDVSVAFGTDSPFFTLSAISPGGLTWTPRCAVGVARANLGAGALVTALYNGWNYIGLGAGAQKCDAAGQTYGSIALAWL